MGVLVKVARNEAKLTRKHSEIGREFGFEVANGKRSVKNSEQLRDLKEGVGYDRENERRRGVD